MRAALRLGALGALAAGTLAVAWVVGHRPSPSQPATLRPVLDQAIGVKAAVDRVGQTVLKVTDAEEAALGERLAGEMGAFVHRGPDPDLRWLDRVLQRLVRQGGLRRRLAYRLEMLDLPFVNACALPGGRLYVTRGLAAFSANEAEAAAVLAHELAHVDLRHCVERYQYELQARKLGGEPLAAMAALGARLMLQGFQGQQELEADRWGMQICARAGYHPQAGQCLFTRLESRPAPPKTLGAEVRHGLRDALEDYFASHPRGPMRVDALERALAEAGLDPAREAYYLGVQNAARREARDQREFPGELVRRRIYP